MLLLVLADNYLVLYMLAGRASAWPLPADRVLASTSRPRPWRPRRRSSRTGSVTPGCRWRSCSCSPRSAPCRSPGCSTTRARPAPACSPPSGRCSCWGRSRKSAQLPLQSWLLDAMEGPTPVSALIHAATMVTAGVYLIVRSGPIFDLTADARLAVMIVGAATLLFGAIISCAKDDIMKALAGSTMSQIGYMILAAGVGLGGLPVRHRVALLAHGFFKYLPVPRRRIDHARDERRGGHAPLRRPGRRHRGSPSSPSAPVLLPGHHRPSPVLRPLLRQGHGDSTPRSTWAAPTARLDRGASARW